MIGEASERSHLAPTGGRELETWRRLPLQHGETPELLAGAEALLAGLDITGVPAMRWSLAQQPALILGSSQQLSEVDFPACEAAGVSVHRRRSGGTAVYADEGLLWLDVALPADHRLRLASVTEAYRWFGEVWTVALRELGVEAWVMGPDEARPRNAALELAVRRACYGGVSPYEVFVGDRKLVGLAQVRRRPGELLQAGMYLQWEPERLVRL